MGYLAEAGALAFRPYVVDGVPASGRYKPIKADIQDVFNLIDLAALGGSINPKVAADPVNGDGTDDSTLMLPFVQAAMTQGKVLVLPDGDYFLDSWTELASTGPLTIRSLTGNPGGVVIRGDGTARFVVMQHNFDARGIRFENWLAPVKTDEALQSAKIDHIRFDACEFIDCVYVYDRQANEVTSVQEIDRFVFTNCLVDCSGIAAGTKTYGVWLNGQARFITAVDNVLKDLNGSALWLGAESLADQLLTEFVTVGGNQIKNCIGPNTDDCNGISIRARNGVCIANVVKTVSNTGATGAEGIYVKWYGGIILGNEVEDCGSEAAIMAKGRGYPDLIPEATNPAVDNPYCDTFLISGNLIRCSASRSDSAGIGMFGVRGACIDNTIFGARSHGIRVYGEAMVAGQTVPIGSKLVVKGNVLFDTLANTAILVDGVISDVEVDGNSIHGLIASDASGSKAYGVQIRTTGSSQAISRIKVVNNTVSVGAENVTTDTVHAFFLFMQNTGAALATLLFSGNNVSMASTTASSQTIYRVQGPSSGTATLDNFQAEYNAYRVSGANVGISQLIAASTLTGVTITNTCIHDGPNVISATNMASAANAMNVFCKAEGRVIYEASNSRLYFARGATPTSAWRPSYESTNAGDITPS